jgi:hypothetical protein
MKVTFKIKEHPALVAELCTVHKIDPKKLAHSETATVELDKEPPELAARIRAAVGLEPAPAAPPEPDYEVMWKEDLDRAIEASAIERLLAGMEKQGLINCRENQDAMASFLNERKLELTQANVVLFLTQMGPKLIWRSTRPLLPPPPPAKPKEELGTLPDGSKQLPLNIPEYSL